MDKNYLRLPPELKQEHGDGVIMTGDADEGLQNELMNMILDVGNLDDGNPPNVVPLDDACLWVQNVIDNLDKSMEYYTVLFCIITDDLLLKSRHFADTAILDILEKRRETFVPVYRNKEELGKMKNNQTAIRKLPAMYSLVKPVFLDSGKTKDHTVKQLKQLFNFHLAKKLIRMDQQENQVIIAMEHLRSLSIYSTDVQSHSMQSVSTLSDIPHSTHSASQSLKENILPQSQYSVATTMRPEIDESHGACNEIPERPPQTVLQTSHKPTDAQKLSLDDRDLSIHGELQSETKTLIEATDQIDGCSTTHAQKLSLGRDLSIDGELQSETKTLIEATDQSNGCSTSRSVNSVEGRNEKSFQFDFKHEGHCNSKTLAPNDSSQTIQSSLLPLKTNYKVDLEVSSSQTPSTLGQFAVGIIGVAVGATLAFAVLKSKQL